MNMERPLASRMSLVRSKGDSGDLCVVSGLWLCSVDANLVLHRFASLFRQLLRPRWTLQFSVNLVVGPHGCDRFGEFEELHGKRRWLPRRNYDSRRAVVDL